MNDTFSTTTAPCNGTDCPGSSSSQDHNTGSDDATWILTSAFITFTMQSGFGLLESGSVSTKNEVNIMVKNASDVLFGGLTYWIFGYAFSFGESPLSNSFCGIGQFFVDADEANMGWIFSRFFFQMSFATTATTIVSGAMAERTNLMAYILFCMLNTLIFCFPAHWVWDSRGWLRKLGSVDIAGAGPVHLVGGTVSLVATLMLGPRYKRFDKKDPLKTMACPTNALLGMFMLWWGWLGFNCGSTFGITGGKWKLSARSAVATITSSMAGGIVGLLLSYTTTRMFEIPYLLNGVLGSLVSVTGICALAHPWEGLFIGAVGALIACGSTELLERWQVDDPVGAVPVHFSCAVWSLISIGIFGRIDTLEHASQFNGLIAVQSSFYLHEKWSCI
ncbi:putative ammonium transporter 3 [Branchiostoma floridae x Branchiostoma belcheri]